MRAEPLEEYYRTLEIERGASAEEIREAWKELSRVWHPDRFQNDPTLRAKAEERLKRINEAYQVLSRHSGPRTRPASERSHDAGAPSTAWGVRDQNEVRHARDLAQLRDWIRAGYLDPGDEVSPPGSEEWVPITTVPDLATALRIARIVRIGRWVVLTLFLVALATRRPQLILAGLGLVVLLGLLRRRYL